MDLVAEGAAEQRTVRRARVILDAANGLSNADIAQRVGISRRTVIAIKHRFEANGIASVLEDARRPGRATLGTVPQNRTRWSLCDRERREGVGFNAVQRTWHGHELQPRRVANFKFSKDPEFVEKLRNIVGLYMDPPTHAIVLSIDEKSGGPGFERSAPILSLGGEIPSRQTHDHRRNGTTTLFAALSTLDGRIIEKCMRRQRHTEFIEFLKDVDRNVPARLELHIIMDDYAIQEVAEVREWCAAQPRYHLHLTPASTSWLNAIERFFAEITAKRIHRGIFPSVPELIQAIAAYAKDHDAHARPFIWTDRMDVSGTCIVPDLEERRYIRTGYVTFRRRDGQAAAAPD
jgi:transposase